MNLKRIISFLINGIYPFLVLYLVGVFLLTAIISIIYWIFDYERVLIAFGLPFIVYVIIVIIKRYYLVTKKELKKE